jgi:hypothetical protein
VRWPGKWQLSDHLEMRDEEDLRGLESIVLIVLLDLATSNNTDFGNTIHITMSSLHFLRSAGRSLHIARFINLLVNVGCSRVQ